MNPFPKTDLPKVLAVQDLDLKYVDSKQKVAVLEANIAKAPEKLLPYKEKILSLREEQKSLKLSIAKLEDELLQEGKNKDKVLYQASKAKDSKEYEKLDAEAKVIGEKISAHEDQELEMMERLEEGADELKKSESEAKEFLAELQESLSTYQENLKIEKQRSDRLSKERAEALGQLEDGLGRAYDRLFESKGQKRAVVVTIEDKHCSYCNFTLTEQFVAHALEEVQVCSDCGAMLYHLLDDEVL